MPIIPDAGLPALKQQIKNAFDHAITTSGASPGPKTAVINEALATEIAMAINNYLKTAQVTVVVNGVATPDAAGGIVTGTGTG